MEMREGSILVLYKKIYKVIYKKAINTSRGIKKEAPWWNTDPIIEPHFIEAVNDCPWLKKNLYGSIVEIKRQYSMNQYLNYSTFPNKMGKKKTSIL